MDGLSDSPSIVVFSRVRNGHCSALAFLTVTPALRAGLAVHYLLASWSYVHAMLNNMFMRCGTCKIYKQDALFYPLARSLEVMYMYVCVWRSCTIFLSPDHIRLQTSLLAIDGEIM